MTVQQTEKKSIGRMNPPDLSAFDGRNGRPTDRPIDWGWLAGLYIFLLFSTQQKAEEK